MNPTNIELLTGLKDALRVVEVESDRVKSNGLSTLSFFFGFTTCLMTAFLFGAFPESVWIVYAAQALLILGYRLWVDSKNSNPQTMFYFLEFCWLSNFIIAFVAFVILFHVIDDHFFSGSFKVVPIVEAFPRLGQVICLVATGPLGWAVIVLKNALVLHDIHNFSSSFIHLWPALTTLAVRWSPEAVMKAYPGYFDSLTGFRQYTQRHSFFFTQPNTPSVEILDLFYLGASVYFVWWVPFTLWMLIHGRYQSPERTGADTIYLDLVRGNKTARRCIGITNENVDDFLDSAARVGAVLRYMLIHALMTLCTFFISSYCYKYIRLHLLFCFFILCVAVYNGAMRYEWMLTKRYSTVLRKYIKKVENNKDKEK